MKIPSRLSNVNWPFLLKGLGVISGIFAVILTVFLINLSKKVEAGFAELREAKPTWIYGAPFFLRIGDTLLEDQLHQILKALQYRRVDEPSDSGEFRISKNGPVTEVKIQTHESFYPDNPDEGKKLKDPHFSEILQSTHYNLLIQNKILIDISQDGKSTDHFHLEPAPLTILADKKFPIRTFASLSEIPPSLTLAVISVEDPRFLDHKGIDPKGILRAFVKNISKMKFAQGGSTITQQLAKNMFLSNEKTITRKIKEAFIALILEIRYSKDQIVERYLNEVYFGQMGSAPILGVKEGAQYYFGKSLSDLTTDECAFLAGVLRGPYFYHPVKRKERAILRRNTVLEKMAEHKIISLEELDSLKERDLKVALQTRVMSRGSYIVDYINEKFHERIKEFEIEIDEIPKGFKIYTTLDPWIQKRAEKSVTDIARKIENRYAKYLNVSSKNPKKTKPPINSPPPSEDELENSEDMPKLEAMLFSVNPKNGDILAMVGGREYRKSTFNRIINTKRQPGSTFKPFVYLTSFFHKQKSGDYYAPSTVISDMPFKYTLPNKDIWRPGNYDSEDINESIALEKAMIQSRNLATARLALKIGLENVIKTAKKLGIESELLPYPSLALGSVELGPMEIARAYSTISNMGVRIKPRVIRSIWNHSNLLVYRNNDYPEKVFEKNEIALLISSLRKTLTEGTAAKSKKMGIDFPAAGKTGTTNNYRDSWFVGFNPDLLAVAWMGFDKIALDDPILNKVKLTGAGAALEIWADFFSNTAPAFFRNKKPTDWKLFEQDFQVDDDLLDSENEQGENLAWNTMDRDAQMPENRPRLTQVEIHEQTGLLYTSTCGDRAIQGVFIEGKEPKKYCDDEQISVDQDI